MLCVTSTIDHEDRSGTFVCTGYYLVGTSQDFHYWSALTTRLRRKEEGILTLLELRRVAD